MVLRLIAIIALARGQPVPDEQTAQQKALFAYHEERARAASAAATADVLQFLESDEFREVLRDCCADIAHETSMELLQRYRDEARSAELAHAFPANALASVWPDVTLKEMDFPWFLNEWQAALLQESFNTTGGPQVVNDLMQQQLYGCKAFKGPKPTWKEAAERLIYIAHNMRRIDFASIPSFGDVSAIFNTTYVQKMVIIAPYDTGQYGMACKHEGVPKGFPTPELNCSSWREVLGTLEHLDHLILPNLEMFGNWTAPGPSLSLNRTVKDHVRSLFQRSGISTARYEALPPEDIMEAMQYLEANILGNPRLPSSVKFLIGNVATLFGTVDGRRLQLLAQRWGWPLFWGMAGVLTQKSKMLIESFPGQRRFGDPVVGQLNATGSEEHFRELWMQVEHLRSTRNVTNADLDALWQQLSESQLLVEPLKASNPCPDHCVARALSGPCVCRENSRGQQNQQIVLV
ncbi:unnamed protein product [Cladocopium goreaui]|uniref:Uncharacterized protein n=1 Tax=Cladocopium goreaui TaxID=2562237 RepID=A0A9P1BVH9_9DINO|nr:unnamed protein product [Cladocopium goreaui]